MTVAVGLCQFTLKSSQLQHTVCLVCEDKSVELYSHVKQAMFVVHAPDGLSTCYQKMCLPEACCGAAVPTLGSNPAKSDGPTELKGCDADVPPAPAMRM